MVNASPESPGVGDVDQILFAARGAGRIVTQLENTENAQQKMTVAVEDNKSQFTEVLAGKVAEAKGLTDDTRVRVGQIQSALQKYAVEVQRIADEEKEAKRLITGWEDEIGKAQEAYGALPEATSGDSETWVDTRGRKYGDKDTGRIANTHLRTIEDLQQKVKDKWDWIKEDLYQQRLVVDKTVVRALDEAKGASWPRFRDALKAVGVTDFGNVSLEQNLQALERAFEQAYGSDDPEKVRNYLAVVGMMGASAVTAFAERNRRAWMHPLNATNDVEWVSTWWQQLPENTRQGLPAVLPGLIGNLNGIPFVPVRDRANRALLDKLRQGRSVYSYQYNRQIMVPEDRETAEIIQRIEEALKDRDGKPYKDRYLVSLDLSGSRPLAAVAIGNLDTAGNVTWNVPGMRTWANDTGMEAWATGAQNLYDQQKKSRDRFGGSENVVVAWVGYDAPDFLGETRLEHARNGAPRLATALDGFYEARQASGVGLPRVNVVAHSYGTPTMALALTQTRYQVSSVTMLGSAGLPSQEVPNVTSLNVARSSDGRPMVFASTAGEDLVAPGGGIAGANFLAGAEQGLGGEMRYQEIRVDPRNSEWGARVFSSEGGTDPQTGQEYRKVAGHDSTTSGPRKWYEPWPIFAPEGGAYLDPDTESLKNTALITTGQDGKIRSLTGLDDPRRIREKK